MNKGAKAVVVGPDDWESRRDTQSARRRQTRGTHDNHKQRHSLREWLSATLSATSVSGTRRCLRCCSRTGLSRQSTTQPTRLQTTHSLLERRFRPQSRRRPDKRQLSCWLWPLDPRPMPKSAENTWRILVTSIRLIVTHNLTLDVPRCGWTVQPWPPPRRDVCRRR